MIQNDGCIFLAVYIIGVTSVNLGHCYLFIGFAIIEVVIQIHPDLDRVWRGIVSIGILDKKLKFLAVLTPWRPDRGLKTVISCYSVKAQSASYLHGTMKHRTRIH